MKKIKLYISHTLDGFIARPDGSLDWLENLPRIENVDYGYYEFYNSIDTVIMGRKTYDVILNFDVEWPYKDRVTYVVSRNPSMGIKTENTFLLSGDLAEEVRRIQAQEGKDIWLVGGGLLNTYFLNNDLIDEMLLSVVPVIIGDGLPLFPNGPKEVTFKLINSESFPTGVVNLHYSRD